MNDLNSHLSTQPIVNTIRISAVHFVGKITRKQQRSFRSSSLPGFVVHLTVDGTVQQNCNGISQNLSPGNIVWYNEHDLIRGEITSSPWTFYTVNFESPDLPLIHANQRMAEAPKEILPLFVQLLEEWNHRSDSGLSGRLNIASLLHQIIALTYPSANSVSTSTSNNTPSGWWKIEADYSHALHRPPPKLTELARKYGISVKRINQLSHDATGLPPMQRLKMVRLSYVRGQLFTSNLTVSEIAFQSGYSRVQDLTRDYKAYFGAPPSETRKQTQEKISKELPDSP
ncbi:AraC family transcriptional regulator [Oceaniferula marina]|nr:AraC family transcriptional regulator [Oceaniferula marina]